MAVDIPVVVRSYRASAGAVRTQEMAADAARLASQGFVVVTQAWVPPVWSFGIFTLATIATAATFFAPGLFIVAIVGWIWLIIDKLRSGALVVTYRREARPSAAPTTGAGFCGSCGRQRDSGSKRFCPGCGAAFA